MAHSITRKDMIAGVRFCSSVLAPRLDQVGARSNVQTLSTFDATLAFKRSNA